MSQDVCVKGLLLGESLSTLSTFVRPHACVDPLVANYLAWLAELFAAELATQFERVAGHWTFSLLDQLKAGFELLVPEEVLLVGLGGVADLVASLADEASPPWLHLVSATCHHLALSSLVFSCLVLLQLPLCGKLLAALRMETIISFYLQDTKSCCVTWGQAKLSSSSWIERWDRKLAWRENVFPH